MAETIKRNAGLAKVLVTTRIGRKRMEELDRRGKAEVPEVSRSGMIERAIAFFLENSPAPKSKD